MRPYDQDDTWDWGLSDDELWEIHCQERINVMQCANWRIEIAQHYTTLDAYADDGIEQMEKYLGRQ